MGDEDVARYVARWQSAGLLDAPAATAIRTWEAAQAKPRGRQWQVLLALIFGAILLGAGVLLFVAAHWDAVSPVVRMGLVLLMLLFFHGAGVLLRQRFPGLSTAMHAVGTISAGAAIALVGQIFNMQEHWPGAILLWALCAAAGWALLRDEFQQTLTLLLGPAWLWSEWTVRTEGYRGADVYFWRMGLVVAVVYLVALLGYRRRVVSGVLFAVGAVLLPVCVGALSAGWTDWFATTRNWPPLSTPWMLVAGAIVAAAVLAGAAVRWEAAAPCAVAAGLAWALPWLQTRANLPGMSPDYQRTEPSLLLYALVATAAVGLVAWGVWRGSKLLVNYGTVTFAMTVMWFYFSSIMDKLGRSLGLIGLGVLFLAGGWVLELTRRRLVGGMARGAA